ncbi:MAG: CHAT domain-containing protein [Marinifilaceae bacterium]|jgi:CHAT domain-containing protein|nr:CHAT domain-containing protein [Marinifilaceae bacterium]
MSFFRYLIILVLSFSSYYSLAQYPFNFTKHRDIPSYFNDSNIQRLFFQSKLDSCIFELQNYKADEKKDQLFYYNLLADVYFLNSDYDKALQIVRGSREEMSSFFAHGNKECLYSLFLEAIIYEQKAEARKTIKILDSINSLEYNNDKAFKALIYRKKADVYLKFMNREKRKETINDALKYFDKEKTNYEKAVYYLLQADRSGYSQSEIKSENYIEALKYLELAGAKQDKIYYDCLLQLVIQNISYDKNTKKAKHYVSVLNKYIADYKIQDQYLYSFYIVSGEVYRITKNFNLAEYSFKRSVEISNKYYKSNAEKLCLPLAYLGRLYRYQKLFNKAEPVYLKSLEIGERLYNGQKFPGEFKFFGEIAKLYSAWNKPFKCIEYANKRMSYCSDKQYDQHDLIAYNPKIRYVSFFNSIMHKIESYRYLYLKTKNVEYLDYGIKNCLQADSIVTEINSKSISEKAGLKNSKRRKLLASYSFWFYMKKFERTQDKDNLYYCFSQLDNSLANYLKFSIGKNRKKEIQKYEKKLRKLEISFEESGKSNLNDSILRVKNKLLDLKLNTNNKLGVNNYLVPKDSINLITAKSTGIILIQSLYFSDELKLNVKMENAPKRYFAFFVDRNGIDFRKINHNPNIFAKKCIRAIKSFDTEAIDYNVDKLSKLIIHPFSNRINSNKNLLFICSNSLSSFPFDILKLSPGSDIKLGGRNIIYNYCLSTSFNTKRNATNKGLLAIAPLFNAKSDTDVFRDSDISLSEITDRAQLNRKGEGLRALPLAQKEVESVSSMYNQYLNSKVKILNTDATKINIYDNIANFDIIHFATHGYADKRNYKRSGLFLSLNQKNPFLSLNEIYNLDLNSSLVVLSACKTNIGINSDGEGNMALPRAFMYAGAKNIVASLWRVNDRKSKYIMERFYYHIIQTKSNYAKALRLAKLDAIKKGFEIKDWAAFVILGTV